MLGPRPTLLGKRALTVTAWRFRNRYVCKASVILFDLWRGEYGVTSLFEGQNGRVVLQFFADDLAAILRSLWKDFWAWTERELDAGHQRLSDGINDIKTRCNIIL